ncbi:MAG: HAMP domain-containing histidine kinase [Bacilli bacterium]|nr:HAMP domain-containing histidine kinase [Bacilli bacterium]
MIQKLRLKFIAFTLIALAILLAIIGTIVNVLNFSSVANSSDQVLNYLSQHEGHFGERRNEEENQDSSQSAPFFPDDRGGRPFSPETAYNTRFFTVTFNQGNVIDSNTTNIAAFSQEEAISLAKEIYQSNQERGYIQHVYRYLRYEKDDGNTMVIVMDSSLQLEPAQNFFVISLIVLSSGLVLSFVAVFFLSKWFVKPLEISQQKQTSFITDAGHELKTPLTIISANNELIEMEFGENESSKVIDKEVKRMTSMVKELSALARMNEERKVESKELSFSDVVLDMIDSFSNAFKEKGILLQPEVKENVRVKGDEALLRQLVSILLDNALKYSLTHTSIVLNDKHLEVINDAKEIKNENLENVFERFYRSAEVRGSNIEGSGIGLSIAKEITAKNKMRITAFGDENSQFHIRLSF